MDYLTLWPVYLWLGSLAGTALFSFASIGADMAFTDTSKDNWYDSWKPRAARMDRILGCMLVWDFGVCPAIGTAAFLFGWV